MNPEMLQAVAAMTDLGYIVKIFVSLLLFVFGGYLLYSAMFAAVGSAVDNVQDASQLPLQSHRQQSSSPRFPLHHPSADKVYRTYCKHCIPYKDEPFCLSEKSSLLHCPPR
jgi:hypothetical protein